MTEQFAPCEDHQSLQRLEFTRALEIARGCYFCIVETVGDDTETKGAG